jgi:hypothetical protein
MKIYGTQDILLALRNYLVDGLKIRQLSTTPGEVLRIALQTHEGAESVRALIKAGLSGAGGTRGYISLETRNAAAAFVEAFRIDDTQNIAIVGSLKSSGATSGIGYSTGAGGTVTQATSKATGVTLSKANGEITLNNASLAADTTVSFTLTNSAIAATDVLILNHASAGTVGAYAFNAQCAAGSAVINVRNLTAGALAEAIVVRYVLIKAVNA